MALWTNHAGILFRVLNTSLIVYISFWLVLPLPYLVVASGFIILLCSVLGVELILPIFITTKTIVELIAIQLTIFIQVR